MTMPDDQLAYNRKLIEGFRADRGQSMGNRPLLLLTTRGRRSGEPRTSPMMYVRATADDRLLVIASNNGAAADPQWYLNLIATPTVTVELPGTTFEATASQLTDADYTREWTVIKEKFPFFAEHEQKTEGRQIPVVALTPKA